MVVLSVQDKSILGWSDSPTLTFMYTSPSISIPNMYTPVTIGGAGGIINQQEKGFSNPEEPAVMINLYIELKFDDPDKQKDTEREFLKRLLAFSKTDKNMQISLVKQPRDYQNYEVIKI